MSWPYLNLWIDLGFLQVSTELNNEKFEQMFKVWVGLQITLFHKWGFKFRLYSPHKP